MMNKTKTGLTITFIMTIAVLAGFAVILVMNVAALLGVIPSRYISPNDVRGIAVEHNKMLYTLNFEQQNALVEILNRTVPVGKELVTAQSVTPQKPVDIQRIVIYRFNAPDIEAIPVAYVSKSGPEHTNLVFSIPACNSNGLLEESTSNEIQQLLITTYDP
ncbi:MAG: hypothetical protein WCF65_02780 [Parachlamydiaceae bacterium]